MKSKIKKIIATVLTVAVCFSTAVCALVSCDENKPQNDTISSGSLIIEEKHANGISLCATPIATEDFVTYSVPEDTLEAKIINYEIIPSYATTKDLEFSLAWNEEGVYDPNADFHSDFYAERWAEKMEISDYVTVIHQASEKTFIVCVKDYRFSFPIDMVINVTGTTAEARLQILYEMRVGEGVFCWEIGEHPYTVGGEMWTGLSEYDSFYDSSYDMRSLKLSNCSFPSKQSFKFGVGGSCFDYSEKLGDDYHPYSRLGEYSYRVSLSDDWMNAFSLAKKHGFSVDSVADYRDFRLENYEFRSLASLIVAPTVDDSLWPTIFAMTLEELMSEYAEVFAFYKYISELYGKPAVFIVAAYDEDSIGLYNINYKVDYVTFDYESIEIPAESVTVSDENVIF